MISSDFIKSAKRTKKIWRDTLGWNPNLDIKDYGIPYLSFQAEVTHCGTSCISNLHLKDSSFQKFVCHACYTAVRSARGNILYYQPHAPTYDSAVKKLQKAGALPVYQFRHLQYLNRLPDKGWTTLWKLEITPEDVKILKAL